jgi:magnesium-transporting ATPase (P-type)
VNHATRSDPDATAPGNAATPHWHALTPADALRELRSAARGLDADEARRRLTEYGPNRLPEPPRRSVLARFALQFHNVLIYVLLGAATLTAMLGHLVDSAVILAVVIANAVIGFVQEGKAEQALGALREMLAPYAAVLRAGQRHTLSSDELVPGDIVLLEAGDKVPADLRLLQAHALQMQEAILTGESLAVEKGARAVDANAALGDRTGMAFSGTTVTGGQGKGLVVATGARTEIGRISGLLAAVETLTTPLVEQMAVFSRWLTFLILAIAVLMLIFGYFVQHHAFADLFVAVIALSVAAIPEGLPAVLTITLAVGVQAMARRNAIVRRLPAIETLGAVSVICSDKTGTLTRNEMSVGALVTCSGSYTVQGTGYEAAGLIERDGHPIAAQERRVLSRLARAAALCNDAELEHEDAGWTVEGDPMEGALLAFAGKAGLDVHEQRRLWPRTDVIPFDARHRFMASLHHDHEQHAFIFVKGAPERILAMCTHQCTGDAGAEALDSGYWHAQAERIAAQGQRVLALAVKPSRPDHSVLELADLDDGVCLLGLVGLMDPPRPEAIEAVAQCRKAGIRVIMITGDHAMTAVAIGRRIGLRHPDAVLTGADLDRLDDSALAARVLDTDVFARTSPEHKLRLVMALQAHGMTVAMTGDGVNDAPALKRADAGIAMGKKGSEAAREAAALVLADDNFASIAAAVREGRTVYDNIKKVISWSLPTNAGEASTILVALLFGMTLPITPVQILWVNTVTAVTLGIALAFEPTEDSTMRRPPRPRHQPLLTGILVWHVVLVSLLFVGGVFGMYSYAIDQGYSVELARTIAMNTLVVMEIFQLFYIRNIHGTSLTWRAVMGTKMVWAAVLLVAVAQFAITYAPPMQAVFGTRGVAFADGVIIVGIGVALFTIIEIEKQLRLRLSALVNPSAVAQ